ncbi:hypothetical protein BDW71DRAFT_209570 [Aspergillus fruticulosus]
MEIASAYESENEEEEEKNALPGLAVTDILLKKVNIFGIEEDLNEDQLPPGGLNPGSVISPHEILWAYDLALGNAERDETNIRAEIDTIMLTTLAVKSAKSSISRGRNRKGGRAAEYHPGKNGQFSGRASQERPHRDKMVLLEARRYTQAAGGRIQAIIYMSTLYHVRKTARRTLIDIYGISTDAHE